MSILSYSPTERSGDAPGMFPAYLKPVSRYFRERRNRRLIALIERLSLEKRRSVRVLDIGGSIIFWMSVREETVQKCAISLFNLPGAYDDLPEDEERLKARFELLLGDARDLSRYDDKSFDLVVCNSVLEHVGSWDDMERAAAEAERVGERGWVQVPAFEFPVEQHFLLPFVHWFADPIQTKILRTLHDHFRDRSFSDQHRSVQHVRPLTRGQLEHLLPHASVHTEWLVLPKSHIAMW